MTVIERGLAVPKESVPGPPHLSAVEGGQTQVASAPLTAHELVQQARAGQLEAWGRLYQEYYARIFRHVRFLAGGEAQTEDLVQEVFARALVKLPAFDGRSAFSTWLHGIAVNVVRNYWRSQRSKANAHARLEQLHAARGATEDRMDHVQLCRQRAQMVYAILEQLPEHLREAFVLRDLEGMSPAEAAAQLGITPGNLAVRASRARERIRRELEKLGALAPRDGALERQGGSR